VSQRPGPFNIGQALNDAVTLHRQSQLRDAEKLYARVLKAAPDHFDALNLLGTVKAQLGRVGEAHRLFSTAVKINPQAPQAWANLGLALHGLKRDQEALDCFDNAVALAPGDVGMINNRANALLSLNRAEEALAGFREVLARAPQHGEAVLNSGIALAALGRPAEALEEFDRAVTLAPRHPAVHFNRGLALYEVGRYAEAAAAHDAVLAATSDHADAWLNRGRALAALNRYDEAIASYDKTLALRKDDANANFMASMALLTRGDYALGFEKYEWRWRRSGMPAAKGRGRPLWLGEYPLAHKTVLVHAEQGLGDTIQFVRYVPLLAASGANVVIEVQPELTTLMTQLKGPGSVIARDEVPPQRFDVHCPLGSLPLAFKTEPGTVPAQIPYLSADAAHLEKWSARLAALGRPRIALAWSGNPDQMNDRNRSTTFARLAPLLSLHAGEAGPSFISIQRQVRSADAETLAVEQRVTHVGAELDDFADTAAVVTLCDLVITVDTSVAHLAGALGRPLWVMLTFAPDWRWTLGESTPWYPGARLFRQSTQGDWHGVVARVSEALRLMPPRP
jgi:tetratricopeptide (TPR) repeat protein